MRTRGFSLIEILVVVALLGALATYAIVSLGGASLSARNTTRTTEIAQIGRFLAQGRCFEPDAGAGDHELGDIIAEVAAQNPQYANYLSNVPKDPSGGTDEETGYRYIVNADATGCAIYANLEGDPEVTLSHLNEPTPGAGTGTLEGSETGRNGTRFYYQFSNK